MITLYTDTDTDISLSLANELGLKMISMPYVIDKKEFYPYEDFEEFDYKEFYDILRKGIVPSTCAISPVKYMEYFEKEFEQGNDVLYIHFSKAMSGTFNAMNIAYEELKAKYPERTLYTIDTKGITILSYAIVRDIADMIKGGKSIEEVLAWAETEIDHYATYFFADNLNFFAKSGRVNNVTAVMGNILGFRPIIYMNQEGQMTNIAKERGRLNAMKRLISYFDELAVDVDKHRIVIGHTDSLDVAHRLGEIIKEKYGQNLNIEYVVVNPTAGSHCGPDTVGICFYAKHR